jgi:hypothetical protein
MASVGVPESSQYPSTHPLHNPHQEFKMAEPYELFDHFLKSFQDVHVAGQGQFDGQDGGSLGYGDIPTITGIDDLGSLPVFHLLRSP